MQKMLGLLNLNKGDNQAQLAEAIKHVSTEFEKVYTGINKFNSSVNEGTEQMTSHVLNMKKKFQELKKTLIQGVCTSNI